MEIVIRKFKRCKVCIWILGIFLIFLRNDYYAMQLIENNSTIKFVNHFEWNLGLLSDKDKHSMRHLSRISSESLSSMIYCIKNS